MSRARTGKPSGLHADLAGVEVGDGLPVRVVGALNVSPESFYGGSVARDRRALQARAARMVEEGAAIIDLGAMSTAPYRRGSIPEDEEVRRMTAAVRAVRAAVSVPLSADTQRSRVAAAALAAGAAIINDVSGLAADPGMAAVSRDAGGVILMALATQPSRQAALTMIIGLLRAALRRARSARIPRRRIVLDPGIGFFRAAVRPWYEVDCLVLHNLARLRRLGQPLLVGASRKSFIGRLTGRGDADDRLYGSVSAAALAVYNGAALIRAHDVQATVEAVRVAEAIRDAAR